MTIVILQTHAIPLLSAMIASPLAARTNWNKQHQSNSPETAINVDIGNNPNEISGSHSNNNPLRQIVILKKPAIGTTGPNTEPL